MRDKAPLERASEFPRLTEGLGGGGLVPFQSKTLEGCG